ncbi:MULTISPECIES: FAD-dependent oxidoreductase [unclassified Bradyrhizobium]|uniref:FAD-dependent oxidoreductase n=1 Tax=unclassified Bradyrhizobium TaxID=2631580 RepID=UPI002916D8F4|nr:MULTISPECIES: FAD-dependent monooxygenase [unclassified Bradyrhizobium]
MPDRYDAVVVGGRCAGAPLAMLLARQGLKVCVFERHAADFENRSTHTLQLAGVRLLDRWGVLPELEKLGAPFLTKISLILHGTVVSGLPWGSNSRLSSICVKRTALDPMLGALAIGAGADLRYHHDVRDMSFARGVWAVSATGPDGIRSVQAPLLVGADGMMSSVASNLDAGFELFMSSITFTLYKYVPNTVGSECFIVVDDWGAQACVPTTDGDMIYVVQRPSKTFKDFRRDPHRLLKDGAARLSRYVELPREAEVLEDYRRAVNQPTFIRRMPGNQACLIGDAWSHKDSVTAQGITDALLDADLLSGIVAAQPTLDDTFETALRLAWDRRTADYREEVQRAYELASFTSPKPQFTEMIETVSADSTLSSKFLGLDAKTYSWSDLSGELASLSGGKGLVPSVE